jgi:hypothetical protein
VRARFSSAAGQTHASEAPKRTELVGGDIPFLMASTERFSRTGRLMTEARAKVARLEYMVLAKKGVEGILSLGFTATTKIQ